MPQNYWKLEDRIPETIKKFERIPPERLLAAIMEWHAGIVNLIGGRGGGRRYRIPGTKGYYTASAPGQPPARRLGHLVVSYRFRLPSKEVAEVGTPLIYGLHLEKGTRKMAARPHVRMAFYHRRGIILEKLGERWDK